MPHRDTEGNGSTEESERTGRGWRRLLIALAVLLPLGAAAGAAVVWEMRTSTLQSRYFTKFVSGVEYELGEGPSPRIVFPEAGPYDERLGYVRLPTLVDTLEARGFRITEQARVSERFADLVKRGLYPLYQEKPNGGLVLLDRRGEVYHESLHPARAYETFDSIPEVLWRSLTWIENRALLDPEHPLRNPAVEWSRLARGATDMGMRALGSERNVPGGSTLATQLEKFRHSPEGRTRTPEDKLRQMVTASARAYLDGPETLEAQRTVVRNYLNTVPLSAQRGHGEVVGTADALWAWYGTPFDEANRLLRGNDLDEGEEIRRGEVFRQALSLLIAHRRPTYYLAQEAGREDLRTLTDQHVRHLRDAGVIPEDLAAAALEAEIEPLARAPERPPISFVDRKAASQVRTRLLDLLQAPSLYELDRYDMTVGTTLDITWQEAASALFSDLHDPDFIRGSPFAGNRLLDRGDPTGIIYSLTLVESTPRGNVMRVQMDNYDGPLSLTESGRLELGSTAKLRALVTYLEIVAALHNRLAGLPRDSLRAVPVNERDRLTRWAVDYLGRQPDADLESMLEAAMERTYSANPNERFATGGGVQTFSNFDNTYDHRVMSVKEAFRHSVNLPSIRLMRDVVHYFMFAGPGSTARMLEDPDVRQEYLARFADVEGSRFVRQFNAKYQDPGEGGVFEVLVQGRNLSPQRTAWAFRTIAPEASLERFSDFLVTETPHSALMPQAIEDLYVRSDPSAHDINDLGFLARIHPLELWVARYHLENPGATQAEVLEASRDVRQEVYRWLFRTRHRNAQDQRIRTVLEIEAFESIHHSWRRLGYPFGNIVPSYGTAIGSSGDRPVALAELMGIVLNDGVRYPVLRVDSLSMAEATPFETRMVREPVEGEQVMDPAVAATVRDALFDVVENGTARRVRGAFTDAEGEPVTIGGKTGTGDNRFRVYGGGGQLVESRAVNRTATFAFILGDRHFGVVTAYVPGAAAANYRFTSGLPSQVLRALGPALSPLDLDLNPEPPETPETPEASEAPGPSEPGGDPAP